MKVFKSIQADCALLGIGSYKLSRKHELNVRSLIVFSSYVFGTASCGYYLCCVDESFEQYITSYYETTSFLVCVLQFINLFWQMPKLIDFFLSIEDFIQQRENYLESKATYDKAVQLAEQSYRIIHTLFVKILTVPSILPIYVACIYTYYFTTVPPDEAFVLPLLMWCPFDWKSPVGYTVAFAIQSVMYWLQLLISSCLACSGIVAFLLGLATSKDLTAILRAIHNDIKSKRNRSDGVKKLYQFIEFHSTIKENICNFMDVFQVVTVILLVWCIGTLCIALTLLEMGINGNNSISLAIWTLQMSFGLAFFACELGQRITNAFDNVNDVLTDLDWYLFPIINKKMLPMIMMNTQETVALKCFGSILCGRETFKNVNKNAFSYFMVLREFSK